MSKEKEPLLSPLFRLRNYILDFLEKDKKYFLGRVLTIIDASIPDKEQRKGIKDLIEDAYYSGDRRYDEREIREILLNFAEKFCPDLQPKTDQDRDMFLGQASMEANAKPDYFD